MILKWNFDTTRLHELYKYISKYRGKFKVKFWEYMHLWKGGIFHSATWKLRNSISWVSKETIER